MTPDTLIAAIRGLPDTPAHRRREVLVRAANLDALSVDNDLARGLELLAGMLNDANEADFYHLPEGDRL